MRLHMVNSRAKSLAIKFCVAVITFSIGVAAASFITVAPPQPTPAPQPVEINYESAEIGTLKRMILEAKAKGKTTIELSVLGCGWDIGSLKEALSRDTVVLAELVEKKTYADPWGLNTWYKFKIKETLVKHPIPNLSYFLPLPSGPSELLPAAEDEFMIQETNGQMEIDGITVTQHSNGAKYVEGQTYLLFLWIDSNRTAIRSGTDPLGVFLVESDGNLLPYVKRPYRLNGELGKRYQNSVDNLRQALKK